MVSFETACKLKDAGLQHEPQVGDWYALRSQEPMLIAFKSTIATQYIKLTNTEDEHYPNSRLMTCAEMLKEGWTWLPRLDQLLGEIERQRGAWQIDTPDEAAASALLGLLEQEKGVK